MSESRTLVREREVRAGAWRGKGGLYSKEGSIQKREGGQARKTSLGEVEGSMSRRVDTKALQDNLQSPGFTPSLAKPEMEKEVGGRRARS